MKSVICVDKDKNEFTVPVEKLVFRPSVYGVIIKDGKILLTLVHDGFDFPGGGMELGETIEEALKREVREETGLEVRTGKVVACENSFFCRRVGVDWHSLLLYFLCEVTGGELTLDGLDDFEKDETFALPEWIPLEDMERLKFYNSVDSVQIIKQALLVLQKQDTA